MTESMREAAFGLIQAIVDAEPRLDGINAELRRLFGDFSPLLSLIAQPVSEPVLKMLDAVLGDDLASYFIHECRRMADGGNIVEADGAVWPMATVSDLRSYVAAMAEKDAT